MDGTSGFEEMLTQTLRRVDLHTMRRRIELPQGMAESIRRAHAEVDAMMERLPDEESDIATLREQVTQVERLKRRVEAVQLRLTAKASRAAAHEADGRLDSGSWLAGATDSDRRQAAGQAALADALGATPAAGDGSSTGDASDNATGISGEPGGSEDSGGDAGAAGAPDGGSDAGDTGAAGDGPDADDGAGTGADADDAVASGRRADGRPLLTATGAALDAGTISAAHAQVIMRALDDLPKGVTDEQRRECEDQLLLLCTNRSPGQLRRAARRVLEAVEPEPEVVDQHEDDLVADEEERARDKAAFWVKDNQDGTVTGHFTVPWASGMMLKKIIDAMTAPRRRQGDDPADRGHQAGRAEGRGAAGSGSTRTDRYLDWQHRRGLAFADLLTRIPTDHLHTKVSATMIITTRLSDLMDNFEAAGSKVATTDMQDVLSAGSARRLACGAGLLPTVLDGDSVPLDLGRQRRLFSDAQRMALAGRYDECAAQGCDRPFAWTETHHLRPWEAGGTTDLDNAVPLCGTHHHMIDSTRWTYVVTRMARRTLSLAFHRRT